MRPVRVEYSSMPVEFEPKIIQARANALVANISEATKLGLDIGHLRELDQLTHERHEDLLMVHLKIKPMATYFDPVLDIRRRFGEDYISHLVRPEVLVSSAGDAVWNPELVEEVLDDNEDLIVKILNQHPEVNTRLASPKSPDFLRFVRMISNIDDLGEAIVLEGVMLGYPKEACEIFAEYYPLFDGLIGVVRSALEERNADSILNSDFSLYQLTDNEGGLKDELLRVVDTLPRKINPRLIEGIQQMRFANVPGTRFFTFGDLTTEHEKRVKDAYLQSGIRQGLGLK